MVLGALMCVPSSVAVCQAREWRAEEVTATRRDAAFTPFSIQVLITSELSR
jgi:hypothetical protein